MCLCVSLCMCLCVCVSVSVCVFLSVILNYLQHIWKDLEGIMLSEISQREIMYISLTYMRSEKAKWIETY